MTSVTTDADRAIRALLREQAHLVTRSQALGSGMTPSALRHRLRPGGPWTAVLPGVYVSGGGDLAGGQREIAAVLYAGRESVITGTAALRRQGVRVPLSDVVDVLIPATGRRQSVDFVRIRRTRNMPERFWVIDGIRFAHAARAVADAVWGNPDSRQVRAIVADAVQRGSCTVQQLCGELRAGPKQGSGALRAALDEVADGIASVAEGDLRMLIKGGGLPEPMYNPRLLAGTVFLGRPDAWWPDAGVACEVDSREWHLSPAGWERMQVRHAKMSAHGILVLHFAPRRIRSDAAAVAAELRAAIEVGRRRPPLPIRAVPAR
jgi:hypothetical protein